MTAWRLSISCKEVNPHAVVKQQASTRAGVSCGVFPLWSVCVKLSMLVAVYIPMEVNLCHRVLKIKTHWIISTEYLCIEITYLIFLPLNLTLYIFNKSYSPLFFNVKKFNVNFIQLKYFQRHKIQSAKVTIKIQCTKFSVNIQGPKKEQSILDARSRSNEWARHWIPDSHTWEGKTDLAMSNGNSSSNSASVSTFFYIYMPLVWVVSVRFSNGQY